MRLGAWVTAKAADEVVEKGRRWISAAASPNTFMSLRCSPTANTTTRSIRPRSFCDWANKPMPGWALLEVMRRQVQAFEQQHEDRERHRVLLEGPVALTRYFTKFAVVTTPTMRHCG